MIKPTKLLPPNLPIKPAAPTLTSRLTAAPVTLLAKPVSRYPHLVIEARAGTGKTTTLIEGLRLLLTGASNLSPSLQQSQIFEAIVSPYTLATIPKSIGFVAFNKSIATELQKRVPAGCDAMTMHSMGFKAINRAFPGLKVDEYNVSNIISSLTGIELRELRKTQPTFLNSVKNLVGLCKMNLIATDWIENLNDLSSEHEIELNSESTRIFDMVKTVMEECRDPKKNGCIDFDDMVWLPVALKLPLFRYDLLLVDEVQDLNRCQQALSKKAGTRLILCGDPKQAIYGFAGADSKSIARMVTELSEGDSQCIVLPLTVTRRCGRAIVTEAQKYVSDFTAHESNPIGKISEARYPRQPNDVFLKDEQTYLPMVKEGHLIICRTNAPLISQCFKLLRRGTRASIIGRDIGKGLIALIEKSKAKTIPDLILWLSEWTDRERAKETAKTNPNEAKLNAIEDKYDCIVAFTEDVQTINDVILKINTLFTDDKTQPGVRLSSIHKAKGLEADHVFFLTPAVIRSGGGGKKDKPKPLWIEDQERNLKYVAITRAIRELTYVV